MIAYQYEGCGLVYGVLVFDVLFPVVCVGESGLKAGFVRGWRWGGGAWFLRLDGSRGHVLAGEGEGGSLRDCRGLVPDDVGSGPSSEYVRYHLLRGEGCEFDLMSYVFGGILGRALCGFVVASVNW